MSVEILLQSHVAAHPLGHWPVLVDAADDKLADGGFPATPHITNTLHVPLVVQLARHHLPPN